MTAPVSATQDYTITLSQVCKSYGDYQVLKDVNENVTRGEVVVICGPSGSGKSTLIRTINRLEEISSGAIMLDGRNIHAQMRAKELNALRSRVGSSSRASTSSRIFRWWRMSPCRRSG